MSRFPGVLAAILDLDGTLTVAHGDARLSECAIRVVRALESSGVRVSIITGNSLPVALGVARYLGARGPVAAENGCVIYSEGLGVVHVCRGKPPRSLVEDVARLGFYESWQNMFRFHEAAMIPVRRGDEGAVANAIELVEGRGYTAIWSGYALHIQPPGGGKLRGFRALLDTLKVEPSQVIVVGDGDNDVDMLREAPLSGAPGDASAKARSSALVVSDLPGALGTAEVVYRLTGIDPGCLGSGQL